jgi:hypothetical protein
MPADPFDFPDPAQYDTPGEWQAACEAAAVRQMAAATAEAERNLGITHLGGVPWSDAPAPPRRHAHWAQTSGMLRGLQRVERCPCGAIAADGGPWVALDPPRMGLRRD